MMHVTVNYDHDGYAVEKSGNFSDLSMYTLLAYHKAREWVLDACNRETVLANLTSRGDPPRVNYIQYELYEAFCESVGTHKPADDVELFIGFIIGADEAVRQLGDSSTV